MRTLSTLLAFLFAIQAAASAALDTAKIEELTGLKGKQTENVFKVSAPRDDVKVSVEAMPMAPFLGLTSWAAFTEMKPGSAMVMGDIVLFQDEVNPAMSAAFNGGLEVTALHNHFFFDQPKVLFMHISGNGDPEKLARGVRALFDKVKEVRAKNPTPADTFGNARWPERSSISPAQIEPALGKGESKDGMFKVTIGRKITMHGTQAGKDMGVNTWAAFFGTDFDAGVDGDFAVTEDELQPVLKSLRAASINIVAIHQHMTYEQPRMMFLHYWGRGKAADLASAIKGALSLTKP
ncbi:MAG: hypothetical protein QOF24_292 [Verrucomicrobiota bacterium]|jgi:hypothetical protein